MGKSENNSNRLVYFSIALNLLIGFILGGVIIFLEIKNSSEITSLVARVNSLNQEIHSLRHNQRHLNHTITELSSRQNQSSEKKEVNTNDQEYEYEEEEYDDPNSDDYNEEEEDDENYNDQALEPPTSTKLNSNVNDTRTKRESIFDDKESIVQENYVKNRLNQTLLNSEKLILNKEQHLIKAINKSDEIPESYLTAKLLMSHLRAQYPIQHKNNKIERKEAPSIKVLNPDLRTTDERSLRRSKRGKAVNREDVEEFTPPEFSNNNRVNAAHFAADESKCRNTRHRHCDINDRRFHPQNHLKDWQSPLWMNMIGSSAAFDMSDGVLTIRHSGIYFVYAQVFYADAHDVCGFRVFQNNLPILQCTTTTIHDSTKHMHKRNSCFTGSLIHLQTGDQLTLRETEENRYTFFERTKSFFGLFKIGNT